eukprot:15070245-Alexandrium_andersonii.AAC.1
MAGKCVHKPPLWPTSGQGSNASFLAQGDKELCAFCKRCFELLAPGTKARIRMWLRQEGTEQAVGSICSGTECTVL